MAAIGRQDVAPHLDFCFLVTPCCLDQRHLCWQLSGGPDRIECYRAVPMPEARNMLLPHENGSIAYP